MFWRLTQSNIKHNTCSRFQLWSCSGPLCPEQIPYCLKRKSICVFIGLWRNCWCVSNVSKEAQIELKSRISTLESATMDSSDPASQQFPSVNTLFLLVCICYILFIFFLIFDLHFLLLASQKQWPESHAVGDKLAGNHTGAVWNTSNTHNR